MQQQRLIFSADVTRIVSEVCRLVFNLQSDEDMQRIFGLSQVQVKEIIYKITLALPDSIFLQTAQLEEIKSIFAKEFIFFQVQERFDDPRYEEDLLAFASIFSRDIQQRVALYQST